jgi:hypothetical protein
MIVDWLLPQYMAEEGVPDESCMHFQATVSSNLCKFI